MYCERGIAGPKGNFKILKLVHKEEGEKRSKKERDTRENGRTWWKDSDRMYT